MLKALKELESYCLEKKDGETDTFGITFFFKSRKPAVMQTFGVSLEVVETEIKATEKVLKKYCNNGYNSAVTSVREIDETLYIDSGLQKAD